MYIFQWKGEILYQMHFPMVMRTNRAFSSKTIEKEEFKKILKRIYNSLEESYAYLEPEPEGSKDAYTAQLASKALVGVKELILYADLLGNSK